MTTEGFRDVYEIGRINRPESFNLFFRKHRPLVPRDLIFEVTERVLADGSVERPLDEAEARRVALRLKELEVESVAILFLHSYRSPEHEMQIKEIILDVAPDTFVTASHELSREYREYERTSTVSANAYVGPRVSSYLDNSSVGCGTSISRQPDDHAVQRWIVRSADRARAMCPDVGVGARWRRRRVHCTL